MDSLDPIALAERRLESRELHGATAQLPYRQRLSLTPRLDEGLSFKAIGTQPAGSVDAANTLYHRSLAPPPPSCRRSCGEPDAGESIAKVGRPNHPIAPNWQLNQ